MLRCLGLCQTGGRKSSRSQGPSQAELSKSSKSNGPPKAATSLASAPSEAVFGDLSQASHRLLCTLQWDLCNMQTHILEKRGSILVGLLRDALSASSVRLYGACDEGPGDIAPTLVLLAAASSAPAVGGSAVLFEDAPGRWLDLESLEEPPSLMLRAISAMEPAMYPNPRNLSSGTNLPQHNPSMPGGDFNDLLTGADSLPLDCAVDHEVLGANTFCALPLTCGTRLLGVLYISVGRDCLPVARALLTNLYALQQLALSGSAVLSVAADGGGATAADSVPYICWLAGAMRRLTGACTLHGLVTELTGAVEQHAQRRYLLDLSVHATLVPSAGSDVAYLLCADTTSSQMASPAGGAGMASSPSKRRMRQWPSPGLSHATQRGKPEREGGDVAEALVAALSGGSVTGRRPRTSTIRRSGSHEVLYDRHQSSRAANTVSRRPTVTAVEMVATGESGGAGGVPKPLLTSSLKPSHAAATQPSLRQAQQSEQAAPSSRHPTTAQAGSSRHNARDASVDASLLALPATAVAAFGNGRALPADAAFHLSRAFSGAITASNNGCPSPAQPSSLRAKAFKLSHTLLQRFMNLSSESTVGVTVDRNNSSGGVEASTAAAPVTVPSGLVITSCGRWVQDVRQPSRDVCLMMAMMAGGAGRAPAALGGGSSGLTADVYSVTTAARMTGGSGGGSGGSSTLAMQSLVLLGLTGAGSNGGFMGLYLAFPSQLPVQLLEALRDSCDALLRTALAPVVQSKLRDQLAAEVDTVRAGVPGSYAVLPAFPSAAATGSYYQCTHGRERGAGGGAGGKIGAVAAVGEELPMSGNHTANSNTGTAGEMRPPGRMARTITSNRMERRASTRLEALLLSSLHYMGEAGPGGMGRGTYNGTTLSTAMEPAMETSAAGLSNGEGAAAAGQADLVSDLELSVELKGPSQAPARTESRGDARTAAQPTNLGPQLQPHPPTTTAPVPGQSPFSGCGNLRGGPADLPTGCIFKTMPGLTRSFKRQRPVACSGPTPTVAAVHAPTTAGSGLPAGAGPGAGGPAGGLVVPMAAMAQHRAGSISPSIRASGTNPGRAMSVCSPRMIDTAVLSQELAGYMAAGGTAFHPGGMMGTGLGYEPPASVLTVQEADGADCLRTHMGLLVESLLGTIRSTAAATNATATLTATLGTAVSMASPDTLASPTSTKGSTARGVNVWPGNTEDLDELQLYDVLGEGASGVVLRGLMGTVPVAAKLIEIPHVDEPADPPAPAITTAPTVGAAPAPVTAVPTATTTGEGGASVGAGGAAAKVNEQQRVQKEKEHLNARRTMFRNAMELAVLRSTTHVNIVQCLGVFDNVVLEHSSTATAVRACVLKRYTGPSTADSDASGSPICTAIVTELCDSSLANVLAEKSFPRLVCCSAPAPAPAGTGGANSSEAPRAQQAYKLDMRGVYLTVLEIALALRHLHARRLVHRDLKPANVLLKDSSGDPRGWITKLADFGFTLLLDRQEWPTDPAGTGTIRDANSLCTVASGGGSASGLGYGVGGILAAAHHASSGALLPHGLVSPSGGSSTVAAGAVSAFYTIQEQACGTVTHMAPEAMSPNARIDASVDVFALGILMWDIAAGRGYRPFRHLHPDDIPAAVAAGLRPVFPDWVPVPYRQLAQACWAAEPQRRPTASEVVSAVKAQLELLAAAQRQHQQHLLQQR